ncbi:NAD(P)-dependent oxidoreductase [Persephonella sp.]|uniref:NAD(P)-dependent oxidoreductase n=1 Tax=Persephonella sp. TaxID=2060922 RepID=UPI0026094F64|nr:NAD(P)-dependent oxidoreductase [Persephonella sp.]
MKIGWIGLGHMGVPMANNLHKAGFDLKVWNRTLSKAKQSGLPYVEKLEDLLSDREIIITMLFGSDSVEEIYSAIINSKISLKGKIFIDMTTIHPETAKKTAEKVIKSGADFLEAPVLGSVKPAQEGKLTIVVSGDKETFEKCRKIFETLGENIFYLGDYGKASTMKLINNTVLGSFMSVISEALIFGKKAGLDPENVVEILSKGAGKSGILEAKKENLLKSDYTTHFSVSLLHKDICYALDIAKSINYPAVMTTQTFNLLNSAKANNLSDKDFSSIIEIYKKLSNLKEET